MSKTQASNDFDHVATASAIPENVMNKILESIAGKHSSSQELYPFGVDDFALLVHRFLQDQGWTKDRLEQLVGSKSKSRDKNLLARELPFLVNTVPEVFFTTPQKAVREKIHRGESLSAEDLAEFKGQNRTKLEKYIRLLEEGKALSGSIVHQVLTAATTDATVRLAGRLDPEVWKQGKLISGLTGTPKIRSEQDWQMNLARDAIASPLSQLSLAKVWDELNEYDSFRSTNVQKKLYEMVLDAINGTQVASVMSSPTGSGKTFGLCAAVAAFNRLRNHTHTMIPTFFYKHQSKAVVHQVETHAASMGIQHCYIYCETKEVSGVQRRVMVVSMSYETVGRLKLEYLLDDDINVTPTCITKRLGGNAVKESQEGHPVNPLLDVYRFVVKRGLHLCGKRSGQTGKAAWPLLWFFRGEPWLLPIMVAQYGKIQAIREFCDENEGRKKYLDDIVDPFGREMCCPVLVADDPFCNPNKYMQEAMIDSPNVCFLDATVSIAGLEGINRERSKKGNQEAELTFHHDTVGKGIGVTTDDERTHAPSAEARSQFATRVFNSTTLTMSHLRELGTRIYGGEKEFRDAVIAMFASGKGLNDIRAEIVRRFGEAEVDMDVKLPRDVPGTSLVFYDDKQYVLRAVPVYTPRGDYRGTWGEAFGQNPEEGKAYERDCTDKIKRLLSAYKLAKTAYDVAKDRLKRNLGCGRADDRADAEDELRSLSFRFTDPLLCGDTRLSTEELVDYIDLGFDLGVPSSQLMAVLRENVLVIHRDTDVRYYTSLMYTASKLISDETLGSGIHLPELKVVHIRCANLSPEQIIQYLGRAGRARQGEGRGAVTEGQAHSAMTDVLGEPFRRELMRNRPWSCVPVHTLADQSSLEASVVKMQSLIRMLLAKKRVATIKAVVKIQSLIRMLLAKKRVATIKGKIAAKLSRRKRQKKNKRDGMAEKQRLEEERLEEQRLEEQRLEQQRLEEQRLEEQRLEEEQQQHLQGASELTKMLATPEGRRRLKEEQRLRLAEQQRLEEERLEQQRLEQQRLEQQRLEQPRLNGASELSKMLATPEAVAITEAKKNTEIPIDRLKRMLGNLLPQIDRCDCDEAARNDLLKQYHMLLEVYKQLGGKRLDLLNHTQVTT